MDVTVLLPARQLHCLKINKTYPVILFLTPIFIQGKCAFGVIRTNNLFSKWKRLHDDLMVGERPRGDKREWEEKAAEKALNRETENERERARRRDRERDGQIGRSWRPDHLGESVHCAAVAVLWAEFCASPTQTQAAGIKNAGTAPTQGHINTASI